MKIGQWNSLKVSRKVEFGIYLKDEGGAEVLMPARYVNFNPVPDTEVEAFVYRDSEDRPVATTLTPLAAVGEVAFMKVNQVNEIGAFLEWGIPKDILVPFREQKAKMQPGHIYPVYLYLDDVTGRVVASAKLNKFLGNLYPEYRRMEQVSALVIEETPIGFRVVVNNRHWGMLYKSEEIPHLKPADRITAFVSNIREDGKLDLTLKPVAGVRVKKLENRILDYLRNGNPDNLSDKSSPGTVREIFGCSKKDFKKALGALFKAHKIMISPEKISVLPRSDY